MDAMLRESSDRILDFPGELIEASANEEIKLYCYLNASRDVKDFVKRIRTLFSKFKITDFSHTTLESLNGILDPFGTHDPCVTDRYAQEGFHLDDLATRHLMVHKSPIFRSTVDDYLLASPFKSEVFSRHLEASKFLHSHGLHDVYNMPIFHEDYQALFSIYVPRCDPSIFKKVVLKNLEFIHVLAKAIDDIGRRKYGSHFHNSKINPRTPIHSRPLQLLEVLASKDLTLQEAAEVLGITVSTANQHIAAAKRALKAHTIHGLVLAALKEGVIAVD